MGFDVDPGGDLPDIPEIIGGFLPDADGGPPGQDFFRNSGYIGGLVIRFGELVGLHEKPGPNGYYPSDDPMATSENGLNPANRWEQFKHDAWG